MKILARLLIILVLFSISVQVAFAQMTVLPRTDKDEKTCMSILNDYEITGKIPEAGVHDASTKASEAESAQQKSVSEFESKYDEVGAMAHCGDTSWPGYSDEFQKDCDKLHEVIDESSQADANKSEAEKVGAQPSDRDHLLGCAIKTGRVSLKMIPFFITNIANFLLGLIGIVAVLFIVLGGYWYIYGGLADQKEKGKKTIINALWGMAVAILSWVLINMIIAAITS